MLVSFVTSLMFSNVRESIRRFNERTYLPCRRAWRVREARVQPRGPTNTESVANADAQQTCLEIHRRFITRLGSLSALHLCEGGKDGVTEFAPTGANSFRPSPRVTVRQHQPRRHGPAEKPIHSGTHTIYERNREETSLEKCYYLLWAKLHLNNLHIHVNLKTKSCPCSAVLNWYDAFKK